jgi:hypothetical protein
MHRVGVPLVGLRRLRKLARLALRVSLGGLVRRPVRYWKARRLQARAQQRAAG